jgi:hypothetical protein
LKLSDFIKTEIEKDVVEILKQIQSYPKISIILWYKEGDLKRNDIEDFKSLYTDLFLKGNILINNHNGNRDFVWYDVQNINEGCSYNNNKFSTSYSNYLEITHRLREVYNFVKFANNK